MSTSTDAILAYGYDLGDPGDAEWLSDDDQGDDDGDEIGYGLGFLVRRLFNAITPAPTLKYDDSDYEKQEIVEKHYGVEFVTHCSDSAPMYILAAAKIDASRGYPKTIDPERLAVHATTGDYDAKLAEAMRVLDVDIEQVEPAWLLVSYWSI